MSELMPSISHCGLHHHQRINHQRIDFAHLPLVTFDGTHLSYAKTVKNLGVIFDQCFTWRPQVEAISRKVFAAYRSLNRFRNLLPISTKINLARSLMISILVYADVCYHDLSEDLLSKLERLQNIAIRFIFNLLKFDHVSDYRIKLNWLPIRFRRDLHILKRLYSFLSQFSALFTKLFFLSLFFLKSDSAFLFLPCS
jgi:hypothetical protein